MPIQYDRALAVEVGCGRVLVEVIEGRSERIAALEFLGCGVHVHNETYDFDE